MGRPTPTHLALLAALVLSNGAWAFALLDAGVTQTYMAASLDDHAGALQQALALLPVVARPGVGRAEILAAARSPGGISEPFDKDGFTWIGHIGLQFDADGRLVAAAPAWSTD